MENKNIRWKQRFSNYKMALMQLEEAVTLSKQRELSRLEEQGLIQGFEYTFELAWNTLNDFLQEQGAQNIYGSRSAIQEAFKVGLINEGELWMSMFQDRNKTSHTYNQIQQMKLRMLFLHPILNYLRSRIQNGRI